MKLVHTRKELQSELQQLGANLQVGFVPTMGALHEGHLSLVRRAVAESDAVVVSIFVNPTQFNDPKDLERYPRTLASDLELLKTTGCNLVFAPSVQEVYPEPDTRKFNFGNLETVMEGRFRPGHFNGVAQVVSRLFDMVKPNKAYFGQKDFQQIAIIKSMVKQLQLPVEIVPCDIVREDSGLALSSRNRLLSEAQKASAIEISQTLFKAKELRKQKNVQEITRWVISEINKNPLLDVEYFEIVDDESLQPVQNWNEQSTQVGCIAVFCGKIRLIDNVVFN